MGFANFPLTQTNRLFHSIHEFPNLISKKFIVSTESKTTHTLTLPS
ncbi:hypothetical protein LEP1GSC202_2853 [Leptospira yanagawae serovar Saopaulo str. Sao Paulo = ATCC 700523]|uniref:Uncharacterized protein n=1 Tax=Leptospira yanagawae serovar Saopaulo str. Sao Paulo = ATCC 700523 TaxID=1249483 RepID=A0A5E8H829_9LEPT|nr:hypothetical protein LEP1GSC202_2853 [Leptospira yanagawae serovar Saopaulo str. Sao Paulo = ATCC 700523]